MENEVSVKKTSKYVAASFLFLQLFIILIGMIIMPILAINGNEGIMLQLGSSISMIIAVILVVRMYKKRLQITIPYHMITLNHKYIAKWSAIFIGTNYLVTLFFAAIDAVLHSFGYQLSLLEQVTPSDFVIENLIVVITTVIIAPIVEEVYFRGILLNGLQRHGVVFAILVSSFIFGFSHGSIPQGTAIFLASLVLGYAFVKTNNITPGIIIHMINNILAVMVLLYKDVLWIAGLCSLIFMICGLFTIYTLLKNRGVIKQYIMVHNGAKMREFFSNWQAMLVILVIVLSVLPIVVGL